MNPQMTTPGSGSPDDDPNDQHDGRDEGATSPAEHAPHGVPWGAAGAQTDGSPAGEHEASEHEASAHEAGSERESESAPDHGEARAVDTRRGQPGLRWSGDGSLGRPAVDGPAAAPPPSRDELPRPPVILDDPNAEGVDWPGLGHRPYASFGRRAGAFVIDLVLKAILLEIVFAFTGLATVSDPLAPQVALTAQTLNLVYNWAFYRNGWTPGGRILRMRIIRADGSVPGDRSALIRSLGGLLSDFAFFIGYLWMLRDRHRQTWHDKMAGTYVVMAEDEDYATGNEKR